MYAGTSAYCQIAPASEQLERIIRRCRCSGAVDVSRQTDSTCSCLLGVFDQKDFNHFFASAGVVKSEEGGREASRSCERHTEGPPQNSPRRHEHSERPMDLKLHLADVEVEGGLLFLQTLPTVWHEQLVAAVGVCGITNDVVSFRLAASSRAQARLII